MSMCPSGKQPQGCLHNDTAKRAQHQQRRALRARQAARRRPAEALTGRRTGSVFQLLPRITALIPARSAMPAWSRLKILALQQSAGEQRHEG
jgi:hypothetical protein